ncbi:MAG: hypothetical protein K2R98_21240 [Gemmataceae bacterium]|nr:hypothetical protein [Gemmataceae bacterium]
MRNATDIYPRFVTSAGRIFRAALVGCLMILVTVASFYPSLPWVERQLAQVAMLPDESSSEEEDEETAAVPVLSSASRRLSRKRVAPPEFDGERASYPESYPLLRLERPTFDHSAFPARAALPAPIPLRC